MRHFEIKIALLCAMITIACSETVLETGKDIVVRSIETHGGNDTFRELDAVSFTKTTILYKEDGSLESETLQEQSFTFVPTYLFVNSWMEGNDRHKISRGSDTLIKLINAISVEDTLAIKNALKRALSAEYVFFQPFRLIGNDIELRYQGKQIIRDTIETSVVSVLYEGDAPSSDSWRYYFDKKYRLVAASVSHNKSISLIENLDFQTYKGILFHKVRKSYFVDSTLGNKQLRAAYRYDIRDAGK
jgi:hypothetical protein